MSLGGREGGREGGQGGAESRESGGGRGRETKLPEEGLACEEVRGRHEWVTGEASALTQVGMLGGGGHLYGEVRSWILNVFFSRAGKPARGYPSSRRKYDIVLDTARGMGLEVIDTEVTAASQGVQGQQGRQGGRRWVKKGG